MKALKIISGLVAVFVTLPIWFFLMHTILLAINADRLTWFLFWIYWPANIFTRILEIIADKGSDKPSTS